MAGRGETIQQEEDIIEIKAVPATGEEKSWLDHQRMESQGTLKRLEETAKYLSGLSSLSLTVMLGPNRDLFASLHDSVLLKAGIISWLASVFLTLMVVFPFRYSYISNSYTSIRHINNRIARFKFLVLVSGALLFVAGLCLIACLFLFSPVPVKQ
jgi:hypothetical protein